jgi:hypothetical protein
LRPIDVAGAGPNSGPPATVVIVPAGLACAAVGTSSASAAKRSPRAHVARIAAYHIAHSGHGGQCSGELLMSGAAMDIVEKAIAAHGGLELWEGSKEIAVRVSSGGFAFATKLQGHAVRDVQAQISTHGQHVVLTPYPRGGMRGVLEESGAVRIETDDGALVEARENPRAAFSDLRHKLWWDRLDILYFATYAIWTYVSTPFVFVREDYLLELDPWMEGGERWRRLQVTFPEHVHTHSREQVFYFDEHGLIRRHDYTAEPIGDWAKAAHYCFEHRAFDGLMVPACRRVYPRRRDNRRRARPLLVWIEMPHAAVGAGV